MPITPAGTNKYLYNGKEEQDDVLGTASTALDWYDYGARFYDPQIGRFHSLDLKAEDYKFHSPFAYAANNPIKYIDENGENPIIIGGLVLTVTDLALISTGLITTGVILHLAPDGSFALNSEIRDLMSTNSVRNQSKTNNFKNYRKTNLTNKQ